MSARFFLRRLTTRPCLVIILTLLSRFDVSAELKLNPLFTDHAVLQQSLPVPVWGTAEAGEKVTVTFSTQTQEARADEKGNWMVKFDPLMASDVGADLVVKGKSETVTAADVLVGEVWVCSGQSNMAMTVSRSLDAAKMAEEAGTDAFKGIRLFKVPIAGEDTRQEAVNAVWTLPDAASVAQFSATAFFFGRALRREKNVPVGLIQSANGGTNAYSWINSQTLAEDPAAQTTRDVWKATLEKSASAMERFKQQQAAIAAGEKPKGKMREPLGATHVKRPAGHYNAMIAPLQPYAMRGVIWYQGEANSRVPFVTGYRDLMFALVEDWRADWHTAAGISDEEVEVRKFPFYIVQLPNYKPGTAWPVIREQMLKFWQEGEETGAVVTIDVGTAGDIHPKNKLPVGERLARFARAETYGDDIVYSGPIYDSMTAAGAEITLNFKHTGGGLKSRDDEPLTNFEIGDAEGNFAPATAKIVDNTVVVSANDIAEPRAVRYAWSPNPEGINFVNGEDLPASPFRTDSWEVLEQPTPPAK